jgi:hypothetical protein
MFCNSKNAFFAIACYYGTLSLSFLFEILKKWILRTNECVLSNIISFLERKERILCRSLNYRILSREFKNQF